MTWPKQCLITVNSLGRSPCLKHAVGGFPRNGLCPGTPLTSLFDVGDHCGPVSFVVQASQDIKAE